MPLEKKNVLLAVPKRRGPLCHAGPRGDAPGLVRLQKGQQGERAGHSLCRVFLSEDELRIGESE